MPHFARVFCIACLLTATGCSQIAQKDEDRKEAGRQLAAAYYSCVRTSLAFQPDDGRPQYGQLTKLLRSAELKKESFRPSKMRVRKVKAAAIPSWPTAIS